MNFLVQSTRLSLFVSQRFQVLFHSPSGVLFTFPSRYLFTIGDNGYLALERGRPRFPQGFTCPVVLGYCLELSFGFTYTTFTFYGRLFQIVLLPPDNTRY